MKRIIIIFAVISSLVSCNFLEVEQIGKSDIQSFYSDASSVEAAVNGAYNLTYKYFNSYGLFYPEVTGDLVRLSPTSSSWMDQYNFVSDETQETTPVGFMWKNAFEVILNVNEILEYGPSVAKNHPAYAAKVNDGLANAYFLRALMTFQLSLVYSQHYTYSPDASHLGVPVLVSFPSLSESISRANVKDTYNQIVSDLETALKMFSSESVTSVYFASKAACKALLSRVYLYMEQYDKVVENALSVISDYGLSLTPRDKYKAMFCSVNEVGSEVVLRLNGYDQSVDMWKLCDYNAPLATPSAKLSSFFTDKNDIRTSLLSHDGRDNVFMKYTVTDAQSDKERHYDPILLRLSEQYLNLAEALCRNGNLEDAAKYVSELRSRSTGRQESVKYSGREDLLKIILDERVKELYMEGFRLYDITRNKQSLERGETNSAVTSISYPDDRFILPIPLVELEANPSMKSNPNNNTKQ